MSNVLFLSHCLSEIQTKTRLKRFSFCALALLLILAGNTSAYTYNATYKLSTGTTTLTGSNLYSIGYRYFRGMGDRQLDQN